MFWIDENESNSFGVNFSIHHFCSYQQWHWFHIQISDFFPQYIIFKMVAGVVT